jgi:hypothetical protein
MGPLDMICAAFDEGLTAIYKQRNVSVNIIEDTIDESNLYLALIDCWNCLLTIVVLVMMSWLFVRLLRPMLTLDLK